jgi:hypothetical protein
MQQIPLAAEFGIFLPHGAAHLGEHNTGLVERTVGGHRRAAVVLEHGGEFAIEEKGGMGFLQLSLLRGCGLLLRLARGQGAQLSKAASPRLLRDS